MSKLEWKIWVVSHACIVLAYFYVGPMWDKMQSANTSYMAEFYWIPTMLMLSGSIIAVVMDLTIIDMFNKKRKAKQ